MKKSGSENKDALGVAFRLLGVRQRSVFELTGKLREKGYADADINETIDKLLKAGYLNDESFATALARSRASHKSWGPAKIARDLSQRGIAREIVKDAVALACPAEEELAKAAFERWQKRNKGKTGKEETQKAFRHLLSRGFSLSAIWKAIGKKGAEDEQA